MKGRTCQADCGLPKAVASLKTVHLLDWHRTEEASRMVDLRRVGFVTTFIYVSLTLLPVVSYAQSKTSPRKVTVYKTPT
jgi:hypothetical protein